VTQKQNALKIETDPDEIRKVQHKGKVTQSIVEEILKNEIMGYVDPASQNFETSASFLKAKRDLTHLEGLSFESEVDADVLAEQVE